MTTPVAGLVQGIVGCKEYLGIYLDALEEHQSFRLKPAKESGKNDDMEPSISALLMKPDTRALGLKLLLRFLDQCSIEVLEQRGNLWANLTLKACNSRELSNAEQIYSTLKKLAERYEASTELTKSFSTNYLPKIYESLALVPPNGYVAALRCVESCLRLYPGPSGLGRNVIEKFLGRLIDNTHEEVCYYSGKCRHLLLQVRGGGAQGVTHKSQWHAYQLHVLGSLHAVLDKLFAHCDEVSDHVATEEEQLNVPECVLSNQPVVRSVQLYIRFRNLVNYLVTALEDPFPTEKQIVPMRILRLISRGLLMTCPLMLKNPIVDNMAISLLVPKLHLQCLKLLKSLIITLRSHLKPQHQYILELLQHTLSWTSAKNCSGVKKPYSQLREMTYEVLTLWCMVMRSGSRSEIIADALITEIFTDITPYRNEFTLQVLSGARKHMSKKARRQLNKAQNESSHLSQMHSSDSGGRKENLSDEGNQSLCLAALKCLQALLFSASDLLKAPTLKTVHDKLVEIVAQFYEFPFKADQLYASADCRLETFKVLHLCVVTPHHLCPPPSAVIRKLLSGAATCEANVQVRNQVGLLMWHTEWQLHPQREGLLFPVEHRDIRNTFIQLGKEFLLNESKLFRSSQKPTTAEHSDELDDDQDEEISSVFDASMKDLSEKNGKKPRDASPEAAISSNGQEKDLSPSDNENENDDDSNGGGDEEQSENDDDEDSLPEEENVLPKPAAKVSNGKEAEEAEESDEEEEPIVPPTPKRSKLEESPPKKPETPTAAPSDGFDDDDDALLADIESSFVDELI